MKIPFAFWGQAESKLPIISQFKVSSVSYDNIQLESLLVTEGTEAPPIQVGFLLSETNANPEIGGADVQQQSATVPGTIPGTFTQGFDSLDSFTDYYVRAYAINSEGTIYSNVIQQQTSADALTFRYVQNNVNPAIGLVDITWDGVGVLQILEDGVDAGSYAGTGSEQTTKVIRPSSSTGKILQIFPTQGGKMLEFTFQNGNQTVAYHPNGVNLSMISFGTTQWRNFQFCWRNVESLKLFDDLTDKPDLSNVVSMRGCFQINTNQAPSAQAFYKSGNYQNGQFLNPNNIGLWDVSNVRNFDVCFAGRQYINSTGGSSASFKLNWKCDNIQFGTSMFQDMRNTGAQGGDGFDLSEMTMQEGQTTTLNVTLNDMFLNCYNWTGANAPTFGPNVNPNMNVSFESTFQGVGSGRSNPFGDAKLELDPSWGTVFSNNDLSVWSGPSAAFMFGGYARLQVDFSNWQFGGFYTYRGMFQDCTFDPTITNWATMLSNKNFTHTGMLNNGASLSTMFGGARNVPTLNNWTIYDIVDFSFMLQNIKATQSGLNNEVDFSTWTFNWTYSNQFLNQQLKFNEMFFALNQNSHNTITVKGLSSFTFSSIGGQYKPNSISCRGMFASNKQSSLGGTEGIVWDQNNNDISGWNTADISIFSQMMQNNGDFSNISTLDLSGWNVSSATQSDDFANGVNNWPASKQPQF